MAQINTKFLSNATEQLSDMTNKINLVSSCQGLNELKADFDEYKADILAYFDDLKADLEARIASLAVLNINVGNLGAVISWVNNFVSANITGPYLQMLALQADLLLKFAEIQGLLSDVQSAIETKITELDCDL